MMNGKSSIIKSRKMMQAIKSPRCPSGALALSKIIMNCMPKSMIRRSLSTPDEAYCI